MKIFASLLVVFATICFAGEARAQCPCSASGAQCTCAPCQCAQMQQQRALQGQAPVVLPRVGEYTTGGGVPYTVSTPTGCVGSQGQQYAVPQPQAGGCNGGGVLPPQQFQYQAPPQMPQAAPEVVRYAPAPQYAVAPQVYNVIPTLPSEVSVQYAAAPVTYAVPAVGVAAAPRFAGPRFRAGAAYGVATGTVPARRFAAPAVGAGVCVTGN